MTGKTSRGSGRPMGLLLVVGMLCTVVSPQATWARGMRPMFEPTDLEMEEVGETEVDLQIGGIRSRGPWRVAVPDFEVDIGLLPYLEFDLDGAYAIEGPETGAFSLDHSAPDSLWPSFKLGLFDAHDASAGRAWALGAQLGPKIPVAPGTQGVGCEGLLLVGITAGHLRTVLNLGGFIDPSWKDSGRPIGIEAGVDAEIGLDQSGRFAMLGELSGVAFVSDDPRQLLATVGLKWAALSSLDLSLIGLWGLLAGSDRYGALLGVSPKFRLTGR